MLDVLVANPPTYDDQAIERFSATIQRSLERFGAALPSQGSPHALLIAPGEAAIEIPAAIYDIVRCVAQILKAGDAIMIAPLHKRLTTTQAADLLGVSRQYLTR